MEPAAVHHSRALVVEGVRRRIGEREILRGVDLAVASGELVTLVGPSGSGKSTFLRVIAGLETLDAGRVVVADRDVSDLAPEKRNVGLVFQDNALFGHLRVDRNIAFGLRHLPRGERQQRVDEMLTLVKLTHLAHRYPHQLSGGEQQRVALARALAPRPSVVLLDEPFGALDEVLREELGWEVKEILASGHTAAVLVTHDRHEALSLGDRVAVMSDGAIVQCDEPRVVYEHPANRFVADFVAVASYLSTTTGGDVLVRPHQLQVTEGGPCKIERVEYIGSGYRYTVRDERGVVLVADLGPQVPLSAGDACAVSMVDV